MKALEKRFELKTAPINEFSTSWHHQTPAMIYKGILAKLILLTLYFLATLLSKVL